MACSRLISTLLLLTPLYVSAFTGYSVASRCSGSMVFAHRRRATSGTSRCLSSCRGSVMMSTPFELPKVSKEEAVAAFDDAVLKQEVPTLVYFHAKWCGPCIMQGPVFEKIAEDYDGKVKVVKLDCDSHQFLMNKYRVRGLPYTALFSEGKVIARHEGHLGYDGQLEFLKKVPDFDVA